MKKFHFKSIRTRISTWLFIVSLSPLIVIMLFLYFKEVERIRHEAFEKISAIRDLEVERVKDWLDHRNGDIQILIDDDKLTAVEFLPNYSPSDSAYHRILNNSRSLLNNYKNNYDAYYEFYIVNPETGEILVSTDVLKEGYDTSKNEFFTGAHKSKGIHIKDIYASSTELGTKMAYSIKINCSKHNGKHEVGILVAIIDLHKSLYKLLLDRVGLGETGEMLIVNEGSVALSELRWYPNAPLNFKITTEPAVRASQGEKGVISTIDYRGIKVLAAYDYIPETRWGFVCKQDISELYESINLLILSFIIIFLFAVIIISIFIQSISKTLTKPIIDIDNMVKRVQSGDYSARNTVKKNDEIGTLGRAFNSMMDVTGTLIQGQKIVSDIAGSLFDKSEIEDFGMTLIRKIISSTSASLGMLYIMSENTLQFEFITAGGIAGHKLYDQIKIKNPRIEFKNAIINKKISYVRRIPKNTKFKLFVNGKFVVPHEIVTIPILIEKSVVALLVFANVDYFKDEHKNIFKQLWSTINSSYSNLISKERTRIFADQLSRTNNQLEEQSQKIKSKIQELNVQTKVLKYTSSNLKNRNAELEEQKQQVEAINMELEAFSYSVSHDLRAPLRAIDGFTGILIEDYASKLDKEGKRIGSIIKQNARKMGKLIDDLLAFSRMGRVPMSYSKIDMKNMVNAIYHEVTSKEQRKRIKIDIADLSVVEGDTTMMRQVWINLISNSVKFSLHRKQPIISVTCSKKKDKLTYCIKDNGAGFNMKYLDKVFGVFQRLHSEAEFEGTGVGLALVQRIINRHNGDIWAEGKVDKGATFYFSLPIKRVL